MRARSRFALVLPLAMAASACAAVAGDGWPPMPQEAPSTWSAPRPHGGDPDSLADWWDRFDDPLLPRLIRMAEAGSPTLAEADAAIRQARAALATSRAAVAPALTAQASGQRQRQAGEEKPVIANALSGGLDASWELDLFGRIGRAAEAARARVEARRHDWHEARISLAAEVAGTYVRLRACRLLEAAHADAAHSQQETAQAIAVSLRAGFTSPADGELAGASAAKARVVLIEQRAECDLLVKALTGLTGADAARLQPLLGAAVAPLPRPQSFAVDEIPAAVLAQRPDLAALERELAAAAADIGAAEADRLPSLSLAGSIGRAGPTLGSLLTAWLLGPVLSLPVLDGGRREAAVDAAGAGLDLRLARWRQGVRAAVTEVEQALVRLDAATRRGIDAEQAERGYRLYFDAEDRNWRAGGARLLEREQARRDALDARVDFITIQRDQVLFWIALYKAVGGGWQAVPASEPLS
mgnify:FL=1